MLVLVHMWRTLGKERFFWWENSKNNSTLFPCWNLLTLSSVIHISCWFKNTDKSFWVCIMIGCDCLSCFTMIWCLFMYILLCWFILHYVKGEELTLHVPMMAAQLSFLFIWLMNIMSCWRMILICYLNLLPSGTHVMFLLYLA